MCFGIVLGSLWCYIVYFSIFTHALSLCSFRPEMQNDIIVIVESATNANQEFSQLF